MNKPHLISTSAHIDDQNRIYEYIDGYRQINIFKEYFKSITIIETISKTNIYYLEDSGFNIHYSEINNVFKNKGVNWLNHVTTFLNQSDFENNDIIIFITGRYKLINIDIISLINLYMNNNEIEFLAKEDNDLYVGEKHGVHTFLMSFTKSKFLDFSKWYQINGNIDECIEWDVKKYMESHDKCMILSKDIIMGVETKVFGSTFNKIC